MFSQGGGYWLIDYADDDGYHDFTLSSRGLNKLLLMDASEIPMI